MTSEVTDLTTQLNRAVADLPATAGIVCEVAARMAMIPEPGAALALLILAVSPVGGEPSLSEKPRVSWVSRFFPTRNRRMVFSTAAALSPIPEIVKETAMRSLMSLIASVRPQDLPTWDYSIRDMSGSYWYETALDRAARAITTAEPGEGLCSALCVLSSSGDGYIREAAVRELNTCAGEIEMPFLLWRCADWVPQVRNPAIAAIRARLVVDNCGAFARSLSLIPRIEGVTGVDNSELISDIYAMLLRESGQASLVSALGSSDQKLRRQACAVLDHMPTPPSEAVIATVLQDTDPVVRRWLLRWEGKLRATDPEAARNLRMSLAKDRAAAIRAEAVRSAAAVDGDAGIPLLREYLIDPSASVRQAVRYRLRQMISGEDLAAAYRETLAAFIVGDPGMIRRRADTGWLIGAIAGLGETGTADDIDWVTPFLQDRPRVAVTVLRAMKSLSEDTAHPVLLGSVVDVRPGVRRAARNLLGARLPDGDAKTVRDLWLKIDAAVSPDALADITLRLSPWHALGVLLTASNRLSVRTSALDALGRWRPEQVAHYTASPPSAGVKAELVEALESGLAIIPAMLWQRLRKAIEG